MRFILDIESTNLLQKGLDYSEVPYKLKPDYKVWCIVIRNVDTNEVKTLIKDAITKENLRSALDGCTEFIGHNIVQFDMPVLMLYGVLEYTLGYPGQESTLFGNPCKITDTLLWSKLLNADRLGGHSLDVWGKRLGNYKEHFEDWANYSNDMLEYCIQDTSVNKSILLELEKEQGKHDWSRAYTMEVKLADLTLKQELFGFDFDIELAEKNILELEGLMQVTADKVNPLLPPKRMSKVDSQPFVMPKIKFKKDGTISTIFGKWLERSNATVDRDTSEVIFEGKRFPLSYALPLRDSEVATVEDIDVVKGYLLSLGWVPTEIKERDLVKRPDKQLKTKSEIVDTISRYVKQTETSWFKELRLEMLGVPMQDLQDFLLMKIDGNKPIYVPSSPKLTIGLEKEIDPNLVALGEKADFVKDVVEYYTYRHRKNSISGGVLDEDGEPETGFISAIREDGRVPTPADTLGANTGRFRHRIVCNVPRVTSLYGEKMRSLFGCGKGLYQLGYDFASLEARIMGHYVKPYTNGEELAISLLAVKPFDLHSVNAKKLGITRDEAKSVSYSIMYGAQPKKLAKMLGVDIEKAKQLFSDYWDAVIALKELKERVEAAWEKSGKKTILGLDGRLLSTRSKHSLINVLFQSGGAISAKWSAVRLAQRLEENGILGNPFTDSLTDVKVWWLIQMHDEQQLACHPSLMQIKGFKTDQEASEFANGTSGSSAIGHGTKGPYIGLKTIPVDCIEGAIKDACTELNLRVDLGFEWIPGKNWGQCH